MEKVHTSVRLKQIMNEQNLKQVDILRLSKPICEKYGVRLGKNDLSQYLSEKTEPGQHKLFVLAKALSVNPAWLMGLNVPRDDAFVEKDIKGTSFADSLTDAENQLIYNYRKLNASGKEKASDYVEDLTTMEKYTADEQPKSKFCKEHGYKIAALGGIATQGDDQPPIEEKIIT